MSAGGADPARARRAARGADARRAAAEPLRPGDDGRPAGRGRPSSPPTRRAALLIRAEGRVVSGGVDVHRFVGVTPGRRAPRCGASCSRRSTPSRSCPCPVGLRGACAVPDRRVRARARLRPAARGRVGALRARRDRRRPDAVDGRPAAAGRARRPGPGEGARHDRRAVRRGDARALERRQPGAARRRASTRPHARSPHGSPTARRSHTRRPSGSSPRRRRAARAPPTRSCPRSAARLFGTEDLQRRGAVVSRATGPGRRPTRAAEPHDGLQAGAAARATVARHTGFRSD